jgi:hypothetical protein
MQVPALCTVCGAVAKPAYTCRMCGTVVCAACFDMQTGTCDICAIKFKRRDIHKVPRTQAKN